MKKKQKRQQLLLPYALFINTFSIGVVQSLSALLYLHRPLRIHRLLPLLSLIATSLLLLFLLISFLFPPITHHPRHLNRPTHGIKVFKRMNVQKDIAFHVPRGEGNALWSTNTSRFFYGCSNPTNKFIPAKINTHPDRYLLIATSGGLNQQRTGITDAVVAAYILNATLVVPTLDQQSYWKDTSTFSDIFDEDWFISYLAKDVKIIRELPTIQGKPIIPYSIRVPRKCNINCYQTRVLPLFAKKHAVQLTKFDYRLSNRLPTDLQKLRCRVNYHGLKFTDSIVDMGKRLVKRMRMKTKHFLALHLRFEPDMLAFSGCYYGGGQKEREELGAIRKRWKTLHVGDPEKVRRRGKCPLTPEEVGLMLRALGYDSDTHIYVASGEVYGGEETLAPLKALFPNFHTKNTLANAKERAPFKSFSSRMAALDYIVCDESDVFVTNNNGNMAKMLAGRRRYFGHKPTIRPNAKKLYKDFLDKDNMSWEEFASRVRKHQVGFMGEPNENKPGAGVFYENPEACICGNFMRKTSEKLSSAAIGGHELGGFENNTIGDVDEGIDHQVSDDEQDLVDTEYMESEDSIPDSNLPPVNRKTESDAILELRQPQPQSEDMSLSD